VEASDSLDRKPFSGADAAALLEAAPTEEWRGLILVAAFTGLRLGDAARLSWASVDLQAKRITLIPSKTKKKLEVGIPIQPDLLILFESVTVNDVSPDAPVFPTLAGTPVNTMKGLSTTFVGIMAAAGVDRGKPSRVLEEGQTAVGDFLLVLRAGDEERGECVRGGDVEEMAEMEQAVEGTQGDGFLHPEVGIPRGEAAGLATG